MSYSSIKVEHQASVNWVGITAHGFLVAAFAKAQKQGFFDSIESKVKVKMKRVRYSPLDKIATLWSSIVVGCEHTVQINTKLGGHERGLAAMFGLQRFPDQSQVNRVMTRMEEENVSQWRRLHLDLLCRHTRARKRSLWTEVGTGEKLLFTDIDQRGMVVSGKEYELAEGGYFGRKRGRRGYQLTAHFIGGGIGEVLDEYFDSGNRVLQNRLKDVLDSLDEYCKRTAIAKDDVVIRIDAAGGQVQVIGEIKKRGYHYLCKGMSVPRAKKLFREASDDVIFWQAKETNEGLPRWLADLGEVELKDKSANGEVESVSTRVVLMARVEWQKRLKKSQGMRAKEKDKPRKRVVKQEYFVTDLTPEQLPLEMLLPVYDERETIERYFNDEQNALGARSVRSHKFAAAAFFQFMVATTNNLLRWLQHSTFKQTELEKIGLGRLIKGAMQIQARIKHWGKKWSLELPAEHCLVKQLLKSWKQISLSPPSDPSDFSIVQT